MNSKKLIGLIVLIFVFVIACAGPETLSEQDLRLNPNEPWTGIWKVKSAERMGPGMPQIYILKLKQNGNLVKSTRGSDFDFKGKTLGNHLKGSFVDNDHGHIHRLRVEMSEDLKSFEGNDVWVIDIVSVKGERQD